jgi:DNA-dependent RNA polymerase auxiliary subunit epsilon
MGFKDPQDIINSFHEMITSILNTLKSYKKSKILPLEIIDELEKERLTYDNKSLPFIEYLTALEKDTQYKKGYFYNTPSKIQSYKELKPLLKVLLNLIKSKISKYSGKILNYIKENKQFDISTAPLINILNVLINFEREKDMFDTLTLIDGLWPELRSQIVTKNINVKTYVNNVSKKNFTRNNPARNNPARNNPARNNPARNNLAQNKGTYPFAASTTRKRRRIES